MNQAAVFGLVALLGVGLLAALAVGFDSTPTPPPVPTPGSPQQYVAPIVNGVQLVDLRATDLGTYSPNYIVLKQGVPTRISYSADTGAGCGREVIIPFAKVRKIAPLNKEVLIEFTPQEKGKFPFHCSMQMFRGTIEVV